jgi:hypothetical protein
MASHGSARAIAVAFAGVALTIAGCGQATTPTQAPTAAPPSATAAPAVATATPGAPSPGPSVAATPSMLSRNPAPYVEGAPYSIAINPADFHGYIDNSFFPMTAGSTFTFDGDEHVEVKVLDTQKVILGVPVVVVSDKVFDGDELVEDTLDYYAEDVRGNVWYFGEDTAEYEKGKVTSRAGSWIAGVDGAMPGIVMLAHPQVGDVYRQEYLKGEAEDLAVVTAVSGSITVPLGTWSGADVLVTEEWTPLEPGVRERKTYVIGYGVVETRAIEGDPELVTLRSADIKVQMGG